jgi:hypothetical protein
MVYYDDNTMLKLIDSEAFSHTLRSSGPSAATRWARRRPRMFSSWVHAMDVMGDPLFRWLVYPAW